LTIVFQSIRAKTSPIEINDNHSENVLFYNHEPIQLAIFSVIWL